MNGSLPGATLLLIGALTACSFAPVYRTPDSVPATDTYKESGDWKAAEPVDNQNRGAWWTLFQDPQLDALEAKVGDANQDLKAAFARLQQARAELGRTRGQPKPWGVVDAVPRSATGRTRSEGGRCQPRFEGGFRAPAAGARRARPNPWTTKTVGRGGRCSKIRNWTHSKRRWAMPTKI